MLNQSSIKEMVESTAHLVSTFLIRREWEITQECTKIALLIKSVYLYHFTEMTVVFILRHAQEY